MGDLLSLLCLLHLLHPGLVLLLVPLAHSRHLLSVIELGGLYYYDSSDLIVNKTFQVRKLYCDEKQDIHGHNSPNYHCGVVL